MENSADTVIGVAEAKVAYWEKETNESASVLRTQAKEGSAAHFELALLRFTRCYRNLMAAQATLDNLPRKGGAK